MPHNISHNAKYSCIFFYRRYHTRVLYIDIDVHHGDGVQVNFIKSDYLAYSWYFLTYDLSSIKYTNRCQLTLSRFTIIHHWNSTIARIYFLFYFSNNRWKLIDIYIDPINKYLFASKSYTFRRNLSILK